MIKSSIIIPVCVRTCDEKKYLSELLSSLLDQTVSNYEVIVVVDNRTSDEAIKILKCFLEKSSNIKYVINYDNDAGLSREQGVNLAKGKYLLFTDADCVIPKDWVEKVEYYLERLGPSIGAIGGPNLPFPNVTGGERLISFVMSRKFATWAAKASVQWVTPPKKCCVDHIPFCNIAMRTDVHSIVGKFDYDNYYSDNDYTFRIKRKNLKLLYIPSLNVYHHRTKSVKGFFRKMMTYGSKRIRLFGKFPETSRFYLLPLVFPFGVIILILLDQLVLLGILSACYFMLTLPTAVLYHKKFGNLNESLKIPLVFLAVHLGYASGMLFEILRKSKKILRMLMLQ